MTGRVGSIGLTGGVGSGKSTVAAMLVRCGAHLVDSDAIARSLTVAGGAATPALAQAFGPLALTPEGALDRHRMRRLAFADPAVKDRLEGILHPLIATEAQRLSALANGRPVVHDVPLLAESRGARAWRTRVDRVLVVDCPEVLQIERVAARPGWSPSDARRIVAQQATRVARRGVADAVIFNAGIDLQALEVQVRELWAAWIGTAVAIAD